MQTFMVYFKPEDVLLCTAVVADSVVGAMRIAEERYKKTGFFAKGVEFIDGDVRVTGAVEE